MRQKESKPGLDFYKFSATGVISYDNRGQLCYLTY